MPSPQASTDREWALVLLMSKDYTEIFSELDTAQIACVCVMMSSKNLADRISKKSRDFQLVSGSGIFTVSEYSPLSYSFYFRDILKIFYTDVFLPKGLEFEFLLVRDAVRFAFDQSDTLFFEPMERREKIILDQAARFRLSEAQFRFLLSNSRALQRMISV